MSKSKRYITVLANTELIYLGHKTISKFSSLKKLYTFDKQDVKKFSIIKKFGITGAMEDFRLYGASPHFGLTLNKDGTFSKDSWA